MQPAGHSGSTRQLPPQALPDRAAMLDCVIVANTETEPACPDELVTPAAGPAGAPRLRAERRPFETIGADDWDDLAALNPKATPFSSWAFHRAWWDAYGSNAHEQTLAIVEAGGAQDGELVAIVPLMHRHQVEPGDAETHTTLRHGRHPDLTRVPATAKTVFFGATYHADYTTILGDPERAPEIADALVSYLAEGPT